MNVQKSLKCFYEQRLAIGAINRIRMIQRAHEAQIEEFDVQIKKLQERKEKHKQCIKVYDGCLESIKKKLID